MPMLTITAAVCLQSRLDQVVRFDSPPAKLSTIVRRLGAASHVQLRCDPKVWDSIVYVHSKDMTVKEALDSLAHITFGEWSQSGNTWTLSTPERDDSASKKADYVDLLRQWMKQGSDHWLSKPGKEMEAEIAEREVAYKAIIGQNAADALSPSGRVLQQICRTLPPHVIENVKQGERVVFSNHPTSAQQPLDAEQIDQLLQKANTEFQLFNDEHRVQHWWWANTSVAPSQTVTVEINRVGSPSPLFILRTFDTDGNRLRTLNTSADQPYPRVTTSEIPDLGFIQPNDEVLKYRKYQAEIRQLGRSQLLSYFSDVDRHDPVVITSEPSLRALSKSVGNVVAVVPDFAVVPFGMPEYPNQPAGSMWPSRDLEAWRFAGCSPIPSSKRVFTIGFSDPGMLRTQCAHRTHVKQLFARIKKGSPGAMDDVGAFAMAYRDPGPLQASEKIWSSLAASTIKLRQPLFFLDTPMARWWYGILPEERHRLVAHAILQPSDLSASSQRSLLTAIHCSEQDIKPMKNGEPVKFPGEVSCLFQEPTYSFPTLPRDARISVKHSKWFGVREFTSLKGPFAMTQLLDIAHWASEHTFRIQEGMESQALVDKHYYMVTEYTRRVLVVEGTPTLGLSTELGTLTRRLFPVPVRFNDLPAQAKKILNDALRDAGKPH